MRNLAMPFTPLRLLCLLIVVVGFTLVGCTTYQKQAVSEGAKLAVGLKRADSLLDSGVVRETITSIDLSEEDREAVDAAFAELKAVQEVAEELKADPSQLAGAAVTLAANKERAVSAIRSLKEVASAERNWERYSEPDKVRLERWYDQNDDLLPQYEAFISAVRADINSDVRKQLFVEAGKVLIALAAL